MTIRQIALAASVSYKVHHRPNRDGVMRRMLPSRPQGYWFCAVAPRGGAASLPLSSPVFWLFS